MATGVSNKNAILAAVYVEKAHLTNIIDSVESFEFRHIRVAGTIDNKSIVKIKPGNVGVNKIEINASPQNIYCYGFEGEKAVPAFDEAANYGEMKYKISIIPEQEQDIKMDYSSMHVNSSGEITLELYKTGVGVGYGGSSDCYCTIEVRRI